MLGSFTADECALSLNTALCYTGYYLRDLFGDILSAGDIIKEELRLCSAADDVVHAHSNTVDTDSVVLVEDKCDLDLCTYAVCSGNENRLADTCHIELEESAEAADA